MGSLAMTVSDNSFQSLCDRIMASGDAFQVAAIYPWLPDSERVRSESTIFSHRRYPRLFAQASYTPVSLIERLAQESDEVILDKLAGNPATPNSVLEQLVESSQNQSRLVSIARHVNASPVLLGSLDAESSSALHTAICGNENTGLEQLERLVLTASVLELKSIARNPHADSKLLATLWQSFDETYLRAEIAAHEACPKYLLKQAANSDKILLRRKAATNPELSQAQLEKLLSDSEAQVRVAALRHIGTKNIQLINEPARRVRRELARKSGLDKQVIGTLSADEDNWVRRWVARNPVTPEAVLRKLAQDSETEVRRGVARNPLLPEDLKKLFAADPEAWVRAGIAIRPDIERASIEQLSRDDSIDVLAGLGRNPLTPPGILMKIAGHEDRDVRRAVILNPEAPLSVLETLIEDSYPLNRVLLCRHSEMDCSQLLHLLDDPEPQVRFSAVQILASRYCAGKHIK